MRKIATIASALAAFALVAVAPSGTALAGGSKANINKLVRAMGYGAGIHNFKNYIIRGTDKYRTRADKNFADALAAVEALRGEGADAKALDDIKGVVSNYKSMLPVAQKSIAAGDAPKVVDGKVKVSDSPAVAGIDTIRAGQSWSTLEQLDYAIGYGKAIHNFKNYVLRGTQKYHDRAGPQLAKALELIAALRKEGASVDGLEATMKGYQGMLSAANAAVSAGKDTKGVDAAVKVSDGPAVKDLAVLRK